MDGWMGGWVSGRDSFHVHFIFFEDIDSIFERNTKISITCC